MFMAGKESTMKLSSTSPIEAPKSAETGETSAQASPFCHQSYTSAAPRVPHFYVRAPEGPAAEGREFRRRMQSVGEMLHAAGVGVIYLVHSSFAAFDSQSILAAVARHYRAGGDSIRRIAAKLVECGNHDAGNYTPRFVEAFEQSLEAATGGVPVRLISWSSENHHLGRADAAVRLIDELAALELPEGQRAMLWGHGHAGNVFAIMSQLLSGDIAAIERFFDAAAIYYRLPMTPLIDIPVWHRVHRLLTLDRERLMPRPCDWVTFGTPVRYGWKPREDDNLLHFIHHRPQRGGPAHLAMFPPRLEDMLGAAHGDYLQQVAIAGTDASPSAWAWRSWLANRRLGRLLAPDCEPGDLSERLQVGARVPECGTTLLVDYGQPQGSLAEHLAGHAVYTRPEWLLFHAERVARHLYGAARADSLAAA
jgi:hypothetical protein